MANPPLLVYIHIPNADIEGIVTNFHLCSLFYFTHLFAPVVQVIDAHPHSFMHYSLTSRCPWEGLLYESIVIWDKFMLASPVLLHTALISLPRTLLKSGVGS